jgi:hypothetical protein
MDTNKKTLAELLEGKTEEEMGEFFDSHDLSEYEDELSEAEFEVNPKIRKSRKLTEKKKEAIKAGKTSDLVSNEKK